VSRGATTYNNKAMEALGRFMKIFNEEIMEMKKKSF
jgi:hypothetical protein